MSSKSWLSAGAWLLATALCFWGLKALYQVPESALEFESVLRLHTPDGRDSDTSLEWYRGTHTDKDFIPGIYSMTLSLDARNARIRPEAWYDLVLPYIGGSAVRVSLDGQSLGSQGDFDRGRSSIWNSVKVFPIPPGMLRPDSAVTVEILGVYGVGLIKRPYIVDHRTGAARIWVLSWLSDTSIFVLAGTILWLGVLVGALGLVTLPHGKGRLFLGLAAVCTYLFLVDFMTLPNLSMSLLAFKRWAVLLRHAAACLFILGYVRLLGRKTDWFARIFIASQVLCALALLFPDTVIGLKKTYTYTYLTVLPFPFYLAWLVLASRKAGKGSVLLLYGVGVAVVSALHDVLSAFLWPRVVLVSQFGFSFLVLSTFAFVLSDILQNYRQLTLERNRAERYRQESLRDALTGAFNRGVLPLIRGELSGPFAVVVLDLDDFKSVNDEYGHYAGDLVLRDVTAVLNAVFRKGDSIVRTGGDEFLVILPDCPWERAQAIVQRLQERLSPASVTVSAGSGDPAAGSPVVPDGTIVTYRASLGAAYYPSPSPPTEKAFQELINQADYQLYARKRNRSG